MKSFFHHRKHIENRNYPPSILTFIPLKINIIAVYFPLKKQKKLTILEF